MVGLSFCGHGLANSSQPRHAMLEQFSRVQSVPREFYNLRVAKEDSTINYEKQFKKRNT